MGNRQKFVANVLIPLAGVLVCLLLLFALVAGLRWASTVTIQERIITPRLGIECVSLSTNESVAVSCYPTAGLPPKAA